MAMVVGAVWTQEERLKETSIQVQLILDLVSTYSHKFMLHTPRPMWSWIIARNFLPTAL